MNFEFIRRCRLESDELRAMYDNVLQELERARSIIGENRRNAASFCARQQSGSVISIIHIIKSAIRERFAGRVFVLYGRKRAQRDGEPFSERRPQGAARPAE